MTAMISWPGWLNWRMKPLPPSPIPDAARETKRVADAVAEVAAQLKRMNDTKEARP